MKKSSLTVPSNSFPRISLLILGFVVICAGVVFYYVYDASYKEQEMINVVVKVLIIVFTIAFSSTIVILGHKFPKLKS